jgi:hypothetical protein
MGALSNSCAEPFFVTTAASSLVGRWISGLTRTTSGLTSHDLANPPIMHSLSLSTERSGVNVSALIGLLRSPKVVLIGLGIEAFTPAAWTTSADQIQFASTISLSHERMFLNSSQALVAISRPE